MSFGASPSDIIIVVTFCKALYRKCRSAGGEYDEIAREVRGLHTVLRHLKYEVEAPESPLNRDQSVWARQLAPIIGDCDYTLRQLDTLIEKYGRLAEGGSPTSTRALWERMKFGSNEMDQLGGLRVKLISHKTSLSLFLDTIQLQHSGKMATTLDNHGGQLDIILDKVDRIATKMQQTSGSVLTSYDDDDKEVWKQFRRELVAEGFSSDVLQQHRDVLRAYIREIDTNGLLEPVPVDAPDPPPGPAVHTERWLDNMQSPSQGSSTLVASDDGHPPSFDPLDTPPDEHTAKTMLVREENMKFPQSLKQERPQPDSRGVAERQLEALGAKAVVLGRNIDDPNKHFEPPPVEVRRAIVPIQRQHSPSLPKVVTSSADEKNSYYINTSGSSGSESESENSSPRRNSAMGQIITTSKLLALSQALTIRSQSPSSFRSQNSYLEDHTPHSASARSRMENEFATSPSRTSNLPSTKLGDRQFGTSRLAPDSQGNEIPPDAKWTKINRRLVSPEVLSQAHKRYEAHPEFVAVLGVLSRAEIQDLAARSAELREIRRRRHFPPDVPPQQPPRPVSAQQSSRPIPVQQRGGRDTPSSGSESTDSDYRHNERPRSFQPKGILKNKHEGGAYTYKYAAPPSPVWSPNSMERDMAWKERERDRDRDRDAFREPREERRRKHTHSHGHGHGRGHGHGHREMDRERERRKDKDDRKEDDRDRKDKKGKRWKENLTAAGIGGAAASLLNVLTEAAEGL